MKSSLCERDWELWEFEKSVNDKMILLLGEKNALRFTALVIPNKND